jgi:hypothetical protein
MTDHDRRRELGEVYRLRITEAGVYMLRNSVTGKILIASSRDLASVRNKIESGRSTKSASVLDHRMAADARTYGMESVELVVLDVIDLRPEMTLAEVAADLASLEAYWREKLAHVPQY